MERISIPAHMSQQSQLDRTHAALEGHVEEEEALAELEGETPTKWEAFMQRRWSVLERFTYLPAPQHDWLLNIETPGYMEVA